jgi:hypothetical protein
MKARASLTRRAGPPWFLHRGAHDGGQCPPYDVPIGVRLLRFGTARSAE